jgi:hypothetical protein
MTYSAAKYILGELYSSIFVATCDLNLAAIGTPMSLHLAPDATPSFTEPRTLGFLTSPGRSSAHSHRPYVAYGAWLRRPLSLIDLPRQSVVRTHPENTPGNAVGTASKRQGRSSSVAFRIRPQSGAHRLFVRLTAKGSSGSIPGIR